MPVLVVIPARLGSTRLPRKPLQPLGGVPLIVRVAEQIHAHGVADRVVVATDAEEIAAVVGSAGFEAVLTGAEHASGTDRVHEVSSRAEFAGYDEILNVQGDEPFVSYTAMTGALARLHQGFDIGTAAIPVDLADARHPSRVKVVTDVAGRALYFSRALIPFRLRGDPSGYRGSRDDSRDGYWQHVGIYAYGPAALRRFAGSPPTELERVECLEQLRALELGMTIGVEPLDEPARPSVDTPEDLQVAEEYWHITHEVTR